MPQAKRDRQSKTVRALAGMHIRAAADEGKPTRPNAWFETVKAAYDRYTDAMVDAAIAAAAEEDECSSQREIDKLLAEVPE